ncbi:probable LRR receptor-like serine/threonine-protein kinase At4g37250 [Typha latifolia]|uniref:probable LRR receptor-like serine/threonine-protein kinase At4g37250 n=1 Tax=Typha latifolia TaxID=4733 RepID=UPI003C2E9303
MRSSSSCLPLFFSFLLLLLPSPLLSLNSDGIFLLSFKYSILSDPSSALADWDYADNSPCSWNGVMCMGFPAATDATGLNLNATTVVTASDVYTPTVSRVISLVLPNAQLLGSVAPELGLIEHLRHLDLSNNILNGTLPATLFNASELRVVSLANNEISGELPELVGGMRSLQVLNLSDNALTGRLPANLTLLSNLTTLSLANNYLNGEVPSGGFDGLQVFDLSSNLVNGSLPPDLGGTSLRYLNLSYNRLTGEIPVELGSRFPANATIDLSFNNLTGQIPQSGAFLTQKPLAFAGNPDLCGKPLREMCTIPSTLSDPPPNGSTTAPAESKSPPAFAAMPENPTGSSPGPGGERSRQGGLKPAAIVAIVAGDVVGIGVLFLVCLYVYQVKKKKQQQQLQQQQKEVRGIGLKEAKASASSPEHRGLVCCLRSKNGSSGNETEETSESWASSESEAEADQQPRKAGKEGANGKSQAQGKQQAAMLVSVDGDTELELETLLKASAYILGATGSSIVYKAVLVDGTALAVRRIGESTTTDKFKDFDAQVRAIAKFRHPNLLRLRGFYWGADEKLVIHDYAPNGSLGNISFSKKLGSSPFNLNWEARITIARGVARGLAYLHEKKSVHGNVKPSNILLGPELEPWIGDFGLERLVSGDGSSKTGASARQFGSKRSMHSTSSLPDLSQMTGTSPCSSSAAMAPAPYQAPESLKNLKPNAKWDVYSFGMVLLELVAGRVFSEVELCQWNSGLVLEERNRILRMADPSLRGEIEGKEEALLSCFKLGFACSAMVPQKRPSMKEAVQVLERIPSSSLSS